jgi:hypothetical protein
MVKCQFCGNEYDIKEDRQGIDFHGYVTIFSPYLYSPTFPICKECLSTKLRVSLEGDKIVVVKDGENIIGSITESGITQAIGKNGYEMVNNSLVKDIMEDPFPILSVNAPVSSIISLLRKYQAILTVDQAKVIGILTNTDPHKKLLTG